MLGEISSRYDRSAGFCQKAGGIFSVSARDCLAVRSQGADKRPAVFLRGAGCGLCYGYRTSSKLEPDAEDRPRSFDRGRENFPAGPLELMSDAEFFQGSDRTRLHRARLWGFPVGAYV